MSIKEPKNKKFQEALSIIKTLWDRGFETYLAGGCVRDMIMNKEPKDFDISTSAKPEEIEKIFSKTKAIGKKFGVILVVGKTGEFEVATFRSEADYEDARHPSRVFWVSSKEDAQRRDFTVNGLFYNPLTKKVIDFVAGQKDIKKKIIRFIGNADERIKEDHLRILRAVRFKNILDFKYDKKTESALKKNAKLIQNVSMERIKNELDLILEDKSRTEGILDLSRLGILKFVLPEIEKMKGIKQPPQFHSEGDVFKHTILALKKLPQRVSKEVAWAVLFHDVGKPDTFKIRKHPKYGRRITFYGHVELGAEIADKICRRLKFSKKEREKIVFLVLEHLRHKDIPKMKAARQRKWAQHPWFPDLLEVWKADSGASYLGQEGPNLTLYDYAKKLYEEEQQRPKPPKLLINGHDVMKTLDIPPGPLVGKILKQVEDAQLENRIKTKKEAIEYIKKLKIK